MRENKYKKQVQQTRGIWFLVVLVFLVIMLALLEFPAPACKTIDNTTPP